MNCIPTLLITGFLGAGKTTLLRRLVPALIANGLTPRVILNDYENAAIDASTLALPDGLVVPVNGSCVCCDSIHELLQSMRDLPDQPAQHLLIEANGTSDPGNLIEHLLLDRAIKDRFAPLQHVAVVNVRRWQKRLWNNSLERMQVQSASHVLLTHEENQDPNRIKKVMVGIHALNPYAGFIDAGFLSSLLANLPQAPTRSTVQALLPHESPHHEHEHDHALAHGFLGAQFPLPDVVDRARLLSWVSNLPDRILRVKGVARFDREAGHLFLVERTDEHKWGATAFEFHPAAPVSPCLVLIGVHLDEEALRADLAAHLESPTSAE